MEKIKILYIITKSDIGGAQKYTADLSGNLNKSRFESEILYGGKDLRWLSNRVKPWLLFMNDWLAIYELVRIFNEKQPDIIHLNSSKAGVLGSAAALIHNLKNGSRGKKTKVVFTVHGWVFNPTNRLNRALRLFYIALHKISARFQDEIICVSEYDYLLAKQYRISPRGGLHTVHNGIDPNLKFLDKIQARKEILKSSGINNNESGIKEVWVGSIGRLVKEKNYETYISAAAELTKEQKNGKTGEIIPYFFLIGDGPERDELEVESRKLKIDDRFFFIDPAGDDAKYLKAFDIFVMSSIKEGLPYILLEAMAAGLPIVVTEAGGIPEIIKNHRNGMMVSQKNPKQLAQAISGLLANPPIAEDLGKSAKAAVAENFHVKNMLVKTESIYGNLAARN